MHVRTTDSIVGAAVDCALWASLPEDEIATGVVASGPYHAPPPFMTDMTVGPAAAERYIALTLACMAARVVSSTLTPAAQKRLAESPGTTLAEAHSLMLLLQAKPRARGRPPKRTIHLLPHDEPYDDDFPMLADDDD